jgi:hypothetical protein
LTAARHASRNAFDWPAHFARKCAVGRSGAVRACGGLCPEWLGLDVTARSPDGLVARR